MVAPNSGANVLRKTMSTSGIETVTPRSASEVTP
jgi:hypothetical protein